MRKMKRIGTAILTAMLTFATVTTAQAGVLTRAPITDSELNINFYDIHELYYKYNGVDMNRVFTVNSYLEYNPDLKEWAYSVPDTPNTNGIQNSDWERAIFEHFITYGAREGRRASSVFDVKNYMAHNPDLVAVFGTEDLLPYYVHFAQYGWNEKRIATGVIPVDDKYVDLTNPGVEGVHYVMNGDRKEYLLSNHENIYLSTGTVHPYHRTDFPDGLKDENHNGLDDRDPLDKKGFIDLNHDGCDDRQLESDGTMNVMGELRLYGQLYSPFISPWGDVFSFECEHGVINSERWGTCRLICPQCQGKTYPRVATRAEKSKYETNWDQYIYQPQQTESVVAQ